MRLETDLAEEILVRLPVKTLVRFKLVSKEWKRMIESDQYFKERQMIQRQSQEPAFLVIEDQDDDELLIADQKLITSTFLLSSLMVNQDLHLGPDQFTYEISFDDVSRGCVDGLICISSFHGSILVFNPSTRWMREVPHARLQTQLVGRYAKYEPELLGFGKDIRTRTYKLVWLYNSSELGLEGATTCEVFDFNINTWRYVESSPHRIVAEQGPIYVDGSLHWFIYMNDYIQILSFDCNTEMFQVMMPESPITTLQGEDDGSEIVMCNLNNRLCVSERKWLSRQDIWTLNGTNNMTWEKMYSLDLSTCPAGLLVRHEMWPLIATPVEVLRNKKLLLFDEYGDNPSLLVYDLEARAFSLCLDAKSLISVVPYFESLISI